jgi:glycerophosphoryl diester phosphodiesterase
MPPKNLSWLTSEWIAHRGFHSQDGTIPENSTFAFQQAIDHGFAIETDVNMLKDGTVVCFHDPNLKRMTGDPRRLVDVTYEETEALRLNHTEERIITFKNFLDLVKGQVPILIEIKPYGDQKTLVKTVCDHLLHYQGAKAVFSFHPRIVLMLKKDYPMIIRGQIAESFKGGDHINRWQAFLMERMVFNRFTKPDFISYGIKDLPNRHADREKRKGRVVISYAAQSREQLEEVKKHYDNAVFEYFTP